VESIVSTCLNACQQLGVFTKESVARTWKRSESNLVIGIRLAVQIFELVFKDPLRLFPKLSIFRPENLDQFLKIDNSCLRTRSNAHFVVKVVARIESLESRGELFKGFLTIAFQICCPVGELLVCVEKVFAVHILQKRVEPALSAICNTVVH
jgi:hypothetical protein